MTNQSFNSSNSNGYSLFRRGAEDGLGFGLYLSALIIFLFVSVKVPVLSYLFVAMAAGVPFYVYWRLHRSQVESGGTLSFATLWMQGITMFFCAGLCMVAFGCVYLMWIEPNYLQSLRQVALDALSSGNYSDMGITIDEINGMFSVITPINMMMEFLWLAMFTGSILSLIEATAISLIKSKNQ